MGPLGRTIALEVGFWGIALLVVVVCGVGQLLYQTEDLGAKVLEWLKQAAGFIGIAIVGLILWLVMSAVLTPVLATVPPIALWIFAAVYFANMCSKA